jgi:hypothetical protein
MTRIRSLQHGNCTDTIDAPGADSSSSAIFILPVLTAWGVVETVRGFEYTPNRGRSNTPRFLLWFAESPGMSEDEGDKGVPSEVEIELETRHL